MPAYNFQERFEPMIRAGTKVHTIRARRRYGVKVGDVLSLYVGMRTKGCRLIGRAPCVKVEPVVIYPWRHQVLVGGQVLSNSRAMELARRDGFAELASFFKFFQRYGRECLEDFEVIWWDPKDLTPGPFPGREGEKSSEVDDENPLV